VVLDCRFSPEVLRSRFVRRFDDYLESEATHDCSNDAEDLAARLDPTNAAVVEDHPNKEDGSKHLK